MKNRRFRLRLSCSFRVYGNNTPRPQRLAVMSTTPTPSSLPFATQPPLRADGISSYPAWPTATCDTTEEDAYASPTLSRSSSSTVLPPARSAPKSASAVARPKQQEREEREKQEQQEYQQQQEEQKQVQEEQKRRRRRRQQRSREQEEQQRQEDQEQQEQHYQLHRQQHRQQQQEQQHQQKQKQQHHKEKHKQRPTREGRGKTRVFFTIFVAPWSSWRSARPSIDLSPFNPRLHGQERMDADYRCRRV